jgi:hypothetical protein
MQMSPTTPIQRADRILTPFPSHTCAAHPPIPVLHTHLSLCPNLHLYLPSTQSLGCTEASLAPCQLPSGQLVDAQAHGARPLSLLSSTTPSLPLRPSEVNLSY